jgi:hypothetical protein
MSLPIGYRILGVLCVLFGLLATLGATLLSLMMSANDQVRTLNNSLGMVALAFYGVFSLVAGVCLFRRSPAAWPIHVAFRPTHQGAADP